MVANKTPPSEMIRVPTALIPAVRQLSKLHREGHTIALLQDLQELIAQFDSSDIAPGGESQQTEKLQQIETKLETITKHLEKMELAIVSGKHNNTRPRKQPFSYHHTQLELQPFKNENLAQRLAVSPQSLITERENQSEKEFTRWTRSRDPMSVGWEFHAEDELYHPVR
ncbi:hypothetical protein Cylst_5234 [Cylindrospermum stagnale PCC 7417]|uniref:Uncharacterized protein n=1 Tax=Cylindrospermum stagnale PCC 7417 TaxID=56107 RepID=K9X479_9NOST|nr:hypothetical protein [Cylindrospermum stagnale]AFZ27268.1 hypothetical protein Cylst_5234 [Cylindrospermum stagnale PCC 7417]